LQRAETPPIIRPEGYEARAKSRFRNTAFAIEALFEEKELTLRRFETDTETIARLESLDWSAFQKISNIASKWIGWAGIAVHPSSPDLLKRTVSFIQEPPEESPPEQGIEAKPQPKTLAMEAKVVPLVTDLKAQDIMDYSKVEEAMRLIPVEMRALLQRVQSEYCRATLSPSYARSFAIRNIQLDLSLRSGKIKNAIESAYDSLIEQMISTLGKVEQWAASGAGAQMMRRRPIETLTPTEGAVEG